MPESFALLSAYIQNDDWEAVPATFTSSGSRVRHDRLDSHFGTQVASLIELSDAIGPVPAGASLENVLRSLMSDVLDLESGYKRFVLDAYSDLVVFWRDRFDRVASGALGRTTGTPSQFGDFDWLDIYTGANPFQVVLDGQLHFIGPSATNYAAKYIGHPGITAGELYLEFYVEVETTVRTMFRTLDLQPYRDDLSDMTCEVSWNGHPYYASAYAQIGNDSVALAYVETPSSPISSGWYAARFRLPSPSSSDPTGVKIWRLDEDEPDWTDGDPFPAVNARWLAVSNHTSGPWALAALNPVSWDSYSGQAIARPIFGYNGHLPYEGLWVASGQIDLITSRDGITWTHRTLDGDGNPLIGPTALATDGFGTFVAVFSDGQDSFYYLLQGDPAVSDWWRGAIGSALPHYVTALFYTSGIWIVGSGWAEIATSTNNGASWTARTSGFDTDYDWIQAFALGNSLLMAVGGGGVDYNEFRIATSTNGTTWTLHTYSPDFDNFFAWAVAHGPGDTGGLGGGTWVVVGAQWDETWSTSAASVLVSTDGATWTQYDPGISQDLVSVAYSDGYWVALDADGVVYTTQDPTGTWTPRTSGWGSPYFSQGTVVARDDVTALGGDAPTFQASSSLDNHKDTFLVDNLRMVRNDSDPVRAYWRSALDAWVLLPDTGLIPLEALVRATVTDAASVDALVLATPQSDFVLDAWVARGSAMSLDAEVA